ncbi:HigA family addiction module antidote protein [Duganella sp. FT3S]|uniref:HigA family addiction module antidote protein n=1 Tax=Rugamonas fusca TaxID=2758568 RepID=A0A7W2I5V0_9BURK|nr:HigA family addiction module antitoxin [Rugamonas fusca]MBA5604668.1 HigA family addiction module antidote protein [Rugamonas fusca]
MSKKLPAIHPGEILREEYMLPLGLSSTALAKALGVTPARINEIVREKRGISADTALRLARFFCTDVQSWLNLQQQYEISCAQDALGTALTAIKPWARTRAAV